jgi:hypothetical protein
LLLSIAYAKADPEFKKALPKEMIEILDLFPCTVLLENYVFNVKSL